MIRSWYMNLNILFLSESNLIYIYYLHLYFNAVINCFHSISIWNKKDIAWMIEVSRQLFRWSFGEGEWGTGTHFGNRINDTKFLYSFCKYLIKLLNVRYNLVFCPTSNIVCFLCVRREKLKRHDLEGKMHGLPTIRSSWFYTIDYFNFNCIYRYIDRNVCFISLSSAMHLTSEIALFFFSWEFLKNFTCRYHQTNATFFVTITNHATRLI